MIRVKSLLAGFLICALFGGCGTLFSSQGGAVIETGAAAGANIEEASETTALSVILNTTVGGRTGSIINQKMDAQAEEINEELEGATVERLGEGIVIEFNNDFLFEVETADGDSIELSDSAKTHLSSLADILKKYPNSNITIQGHTDNQGNDENNQTLSEGRAIASANYIAKNGIEATRMAVIGFGGQEPKYSNETETGREQNRRIEFLITANENMISEAEREAANNGS